MGTSAAFFDLDKTILTRSSTLAFGRPLRDNGLINRRTVLKGVYAQAVYLAVGADAGQMDRIRDRVAALCAGWEVARVRGIVRSALHEIVNPMIYAEATALMDQHRAAGRDLVIVSSSGADVVDPIGEMLGVDEVIATRMVVADGRYTGEVEFYAYGENKARAVRELAERHGYRLSECYAYSDSATDLPLLETVGYPTAVNPDRALRRIAAARGWPVLLFDRPTGTRSAADRSEASNRAGIRSRSAPLVATVAVGALAGATWYAARRRAPDRPGGPPGHGRAHRSTRSTQRASAVPVSRRRT